MENNTLNELRQIAKERKIKNYNKLTRQDLVRAIEQNTASQMSILPWLVPRPVVQRPVPLHVLWFKDLFLLHVLSDISLTNQFHHHLHPLF